MAGPGLFEKIYITQKNTVCRAEKVEWTPRATNGGAPPGGGSFYFRVKMRKLNFSLASRQAKKQLVASANGFILTLHIT